MTDRDRARRLDQLARDLRVAARLATELRQSISSDAQTLVTLEGTLDGLERFAAPAPVRHDGGRLMEMVYRRNVRFCTSCHERLDTTAAWRACKTAGQITSPADLRDAAQRLDTDASTGRR